MRSAPLVLVVDDQPQNRKLLTALLEPEGYEVESAGSGEEALACVARRVSDLVLLDLMMPGMDGYEVAQALKADPVSAGTPIIMVSAHSTAAPACGGCSPGRRTSSPSRSTAPSSGCGCATCCGSRSSRTRCRTRALRSRRRCSPAPPPCSTRRTTTR